MRWTLPLLIFTFLISSMAATGSLNSAFAKSGKTPQLIAQASPSKTTTAVQNKPASRDPLAGLGPYARVAKGTPYGPNIIGLQLGMTLKEADKVIRKYKRPTDVVVGKAPKPFIQAKGYVLDPGNESITILTLDSPAGERVAGYTRYMYFDPGKTPALAAVVSSVEKKYGQPTYVHHVGGNFEMRWLTNAKGKHVTIDEFGDPIGVGRCEKAAQLRFDNKVFSGPAKGSSYMWYLPWFKERPAGNLWYLKASDKGIIQPNRCGTTLVSAYNNGIRSQTGATLSLALFDSAWIAEAVKKQEKADAAQGVK